MENTKNDPLLGKTILGKYLIIKKIGEGSFGKIYKAESDNQYYALKVEKKRKGHSLLKKEAETMKLIQGIGIPFVKKYIQFEQYNIMIMQLLGPSLENILHKLPTKKMSLKTVSMLGIQIIKILKLIHDKHYIHRDIKPDNFSMGINEDNNKLFIIDFGLSKQFRDPNTLIQNPLIKRKKLTGTARYASIHALEGYEQSRRDDLESVGYLIIYLLKGFLPWQGLLMKSKSEKYSKILQKKKEISEDELCQSLPFQIKDFLIYVKELKYEEEPNYDFLINLFYDVINSLNEEFDRIYDWNFNKSCIYQINRFSNQLMSVQQRKYSNSPFNKKKNNLSYYLINNHSNSNFGTKPNETLSNNGRMSSFQGLFKSNNINFNEENKLSFISNEFDKDVYDNKYISQVCKRNTSIYLYKSNINNNNNKCTCCSIM